MPWLLLRATASRKSAFNRWTDASKQESSAVARRRTFCCMTWQDARHMSQLQATGGGRKYIPCHPVPSRPIPSHLAPPHLFLSASPRDPNPIPFPPSPIPSPPTPFNLFQSILAHPIPPHRIPFYPIPFHPFSSQPAQPHPYSIPSSPRPIPANTTSPYPTTSHLTLNPLNRIQPNPIPSHRIASHPTPPHPPLTTPHTPSRPIPLHPI